jgi:hypothetical protein
MKRKSNPNRRPLQRVVYLPIPWNLRCSRGEQVSYHINLSYQSPFCLILKASFWARSSISYLPLTSYCRAPPKRKGHQGFLKVNDFLRVRFLIRIPHMTFVPSILYFSSKESKQAAFPINILKRGERKTRLRKVGENI